MKSKYMKQTMKINNQSRPIGKKQYKHACLAIAVGSMILPGAATAATVFITNHSFETPDADVSDNAGRNESAFNSGTNGALITGWVVVHTAGDTSGGGWDAYGVADATFNAGAPAAPFDGRQSAWVNLRDTGSGPTLERGSAYIESSATLGLIQANTLYTLDLAVGDRGNAGWNVRYDIGFLANGVALTGFTSITDIASLTPTAVPSFTFNSQDNPGFVGQDLKIRIIMTNESTSGNFSQAAIDNVRLDATVIPEPSTALLGGLGMLALLRRRRS